MTAIASKSAADRKGGAYRGSGYPSDRRSQGFLCGRLRPEVAGNRTFCPAFGRTDWITALPLKEEIGRRKQPATPGQFWTPIAGQPWKPIDRSERREAVLWRQTPKA